MSERRTFFEKRDTLPGLALIVVVVMIIIREINYIINLGVWSISDIYEFVGILLPILAFFGGTTIGFLVSQFWHIIWIFLHDIIYVRLYRLPYNVFIDEFNIKRDPRILFTVLDYFDNTAKNGIKSYLTRRWDLINIFGSSITAIIFGIFTGRYLKSYLIEKYIQDENYIRCTCFERGLICVFALISIIMFFSIVWLLYNNFNMTIFQIRERIQKNKANGGRGIRDVVPEQYLQENAPARKPTPFKPSCPN